MHFFSFEKVLLEESVFYFYKTVGKPRENRAWGDCRRQSTILSLARLPVPTLPHYATDLRGFFSTAQYFFGLGVQDYVFSIGLARLTLLIITLEVKNVNRFLIVFCVCFSAKTKDTRTFKRVSRQQAWEVFME